MSSEQVTCSWCGFQFIIDPTTSARAFSCPQCNEPSSLGALRRPSVGNEIIQINKAKSEAIAANLYQHTVPYVFKRRDGSEAHASGTLVQIQGRHLIATVAHAIPRDIHSVWLVRKNATILLPEFGGEIIRRVKTGDDRLDVAALEVKPGVASRAGVIPLPLDRVLDAGSGNPNLKVTILGYPQDYRSNNQQLEGMRGFYGLSYGSEPIEPNRWQAIPDLPSVIDPDVHSILEYCDDIVDIGPPLPIPPGLPEPFGLSGGGWWQLKELHSESELWTADAHRLFAIQSARLRDQPFLVGIQIIHWLKLVADEYPDLSPELHKAFPRLGDLAPQS